MKMFLNAMVVIAIASFATGSAFGRYADDFEGWDDGELLWGNTGAGGARWNSSGYNQSTNQTAPSQVSAGLGLGGSKGVSSAVGAQGSANINVEDHIRDGKLKAQVDINVSHPGGGDIAFALGTASTWNEGNTSSMDFFGARARHIGDLGMENMVASSHDFAQPAGEHPIAGNAASQGWMQLKIEIDITNNTGGVWIRNIDDNTGAPTGAWSGGEWNMETGGAGGSNKAIFFSDGDYSTMVINLLSQGGNSHEGSRYDNLIITPEPASLGLLSLGALVMLRRRRA